MSEQDQESEIRKTALQLVSDLLRQNWPRVVTEREESAKKRASISLSVAVCTLGNKPTVRAKITGGAKWKDEAEDVVKDPDQLELPGGEG